MMNSEQPDDTQVRWRVTTRADDVTQVEIIGELNEQTDLMPLVSELSGAVTLHLGQVKRINSCGVREWIQFVRKLSESAQVSFSHCSIVCVNQLNMIRNFRGDADILSFYAPYVCEDCDLDLQKLIDVKRDLAAGTERLPEFRCDECGEPLEFDDFPSRYLSFLACPSR